MNQHKQTKLYYCYSAKMFKYLVATDNLPIDVGRHKETGKRFWVFKQTGHLDKSLESYVA